MNNAPERAPVEAVLIVGPTGSGKTPLGECIAAQGLGGRRCRHFDFGAELRAAAEPSKNNGSNCLERLDREFIGKVLNEGLLLEDSHFPLALRIFENFLLREGAGGEDLVILNGLPRHKGQAGSLALHANVAMVFELSCDEGIVFDRLRLNTGGDRCDRDDDFKLLVLKKLETYRERTLPLLVHYRALGVPVVSLPVASDQTPSQAFELLNEFAGPLKL